MTSETALPDLPLHRSLLRAAVLAPVSALPPALGLAASGLPGNPPLLQLAVGFTGWAALLVVAGDLAGAGPWWRRALILFAAPALLPILLLTVLIQIERGRFDRESAWQAPYRAFEALTSQHLAWGVALLLASVVPFVAVLCCRAAPRRRPTWAHAAVILLAGYTGLLVFEHVADDVRAPLYHARPLLLVAGSVLALLLVTAEARLSASQREGLRALAGRRPPRSPSWQRDLAILAAGMAVAAGLAIEVYPRHYDRRLETRACAGDHEALAFLARTRNEPWRIETALDSPRPRERAAACRVIAAESWSYGDKRWLEHLALAVADPDPLVRLEARIATVAVGLPPEPGVSLLPLLAALPPAERSDLARRLVDLINSRGHEGHDLADFVRLLLAATATAERQGVLLLERWISWLAPVDQLPEPTPELSAMLRPALAGVDPTMLSPELRRLAGLDDPAPPAEDRRR